MHISQIERWRHDHTFGLDAVSRGERRTLAVALITAVFMGVEIAGGLAFGSMALLADGLHMGSHAVALGIAVIAYVYARRRAADARFSFGTGKVNALGGFTGALLLVGFAGLMAWESVERFLEPVPIAFDWAIAVAALGLLVNGASALLLGHPHPGSNAGDDDHHGHEHRAEPRAAESGRTQAPHPSPPEHDHNLRAAYLHVLADALTSLTALAALLSGKYLGWAWLDPVMGVVGSLLVARWSWGLLRQTSGVLLDQQAPAEALERARGAIEAGSDDRVVDLHLWTIGPGVRAACIAVVTHAPRDPEHYKRRLPEELGVAHATVEVHSCPEPEPSAACA